MRRIALLTAALLAVATPARAERAGTPTPGQILDRVIERATECVRALVEAIPRYGAPRLDDQGNIVIPRLPPPEPAPDRRDMTKT